MTLTQITEKGIKDGEIVNADINASAAIAKSKLASLDIVNADINASAAIAGSKISPDFGSQNIVTTGNGGIGTTSVPTGFKLAVNGDLSLGETSGNDNTFIDQKQNGHLEIINSGRDDDAAGLRINRMNSIGGDTTYFRDVNIYDGKGTSVMYVDGSAASVGIGTTSPNGKLHIISSSASITSVSADANELVLENNGNCGMTIASSGTTQGAIVFADSGNNDIGRIIYDHNDNSMFFKTADLERMRIDSSGRLLIGATSARVIANVTCKTQIEATDGSAALSITRNDNAAAASTARLNFGRSRATSVGGVTAVTTNDILGEIRFSGADGNDLTNHAASISAVVDGSVSNNTVPGRLVFSTATGSDPVERMRIDSSGKVGIGTTSLGTANLTIKGTTNAYGGVGNATVSVGAALQLEDDQGRKVSFWAPKTGEGAIGSITNHDFVVVTGNAEKARFSNNTGDFSLANGNLVFSTSGTGIDFGTTSDATGKTSELLDDYEEGTWTPVIGSGSTTNIYSPRYTKIGNLCTISFSAYGFSDNSSSTALYFTGLPFTSDSQGGAGLSVGACFTAKFSVESNIISYVGASTTTIRFYDHGTGDYDSVRHNNINGTDTTHRIFTTITYTTA